MYIIGHTFIQDCLVSKKKIHELQILKISGVAKTKNQDYVFYHTVMKKYKDKDKNKMGNMCYIFWKQGIQEHQILNSEQTQY